MLRQLLIHLQLLQRALTILNIATMFLLIGVQMIMVSLNLDTLMLHALYLMHLAMQILIVILISMMF